MRWPLRLVLGVLLGAGICSAQFTWVSFVTLSNDLPNGQVGLTAFNGKLIMTWGDQNNGYLMASTSSDGVNWSTPAIAIYYPFVSASPPPSASSWCCGAGPPYASGGVNMTSSNACGYAYVAFRYGNSIYAARTQDGTNWSGSLLWTVSSPSGYSSPGTSSPALYGGSTSPIIDFAFPVSEGGVLQPDGAPTNTGYTTIGYKLVLAQVNCDLSAPQPLANQCFFGTSQIAHAMIALLVPMVMVT